MALIDLDPTLPVDQVRATIGDASKQLVSDEYIAAILLANSDDIDKSALQCLQTIVAELSNKPREIVGDVEVDWPSVYRAKKDLLDKLLRDPAYGAKVVLHHFGGTTSTEVDANRYNPLSVTSGISKGEFTTTSTIKSFIY